MCPLLSPPEIHTVDACIMCIHRRCVREAVIAANLQKMRPLCIVIAVLAFCAIASSDQAKDGLFLCFSLFFCLFVAVCCCVVVMSIVACAVL